MRSRLGPSHIPWETECQSHSLGPDSQFYKFKIQRSANFVLFGNVDWPILSKDLDFEDQKLLREGGGKELRTPQEVTSALSVG